MADEMTGAGSALGLRAAVEALSSDGWGGAAAGGAASLSGNAPCSAGESTGARAPFGLLAALEALSSDGWGGAAAGGAASLTRVACFHQLAASCWPWLRAGK